jgi:hypothetical protein
MTNPFARPVPGVSKPLKGSRFEKRGNEQRRLACAKSNQR